MHQNQNGRNVTTTTPHRLSTVVVIGGCGGTPATVTTTTTNANGITLNQVGGNGNNVMPVGSRVTSNANARRGTGVVM